MMQYQARALTELGVTVSVHGVSDAYTDEDRPGWGLASVHAYSTPVPRLAFAPQLKRDLMRTDADIVHQHGLWQYPSIAVRKLGRRGGRHVVISPHGMLDPWALRNSRVKKALFARLIERGNLTRASVIHCVSEPEHEAVRAFGVKTPIALIPNGIDLAESVGPEKAPSRWCSDGRRTLLFLGRVHPKKGLIETILAWSLLRNHKPELFRQWRLVVAGWDDRGHEHECRALVSKLNLERHVSFLGPVFSTEKAYAFANSDAFILASHSEGFPIAVLEAWAWALPVYMTTACNIPDAFRHAAAIEIDPRPASIAEKLGEWLDLEEAKEVGLRGLDLVRSKFTQERVTRELHRLYLWLLGDVAKPNFVDG